MRRLVFALPVLIAALVGCTADPAPSRPDDRGVKPRAPFAITHRATPAVDDPQRYDIVLAITSGRSLASTQLAIAAGPGVSVLDPAPPTDLGALVAGVEKQVEFVVRTAGALGTLTATISPQGSSMQQSHIVRLGAAAAPVADVPPPGEAPRATITPEGERVIINQGTPR